MNTFENFTSSCIFAFLHLMSFPQLFDVRDSRFSTEFHSSIENLLQVFVSQLVKKRQDKFQVSKVH